MMTRLETRPTDGERIDERTHRWIERARALQAASNWRRVLGLANRGYRRGVRHPVLMALGGEAALHRGRPAEAIRLLCWAQMAGLEETDGALSLLKGLALLRLGSHVTARRWLLRAIGRARRAGSAEIEIRAAEALAQCARALGEAETAEFWSRQATLRRYMGPPPPREPELELAPTGV